LAIAALPLPRKGLKEQVTTPQERRPTGICAGAPLFNTYISDLPTTVSRKYAYAGDLAIMRTDGDWQWKGAEEGHDNPR